jgi:hypothetical protein
MHHLSKTRKAKRQQSGLISTIVLLVIALIILGYNNISLESLVTAPVVKENLIFAGKLILQGIAKIWQMSIEFAQSKI